MTSQCYRISLANVFTAFWTLCLSITFDLLKLSLNFFKRTYAWIQIFAIHVVRNAYVL